MTAQNIEPRHLLDTAPGAVIGKRPIRVAAIVWAANMYLIEYAAPDKSASKAKAANGCDNLRHCLL